MTRTNTKPGGTRIADLRAGLRASSEKPRFEKAPPRPKKKQAKTETVDDRAEKAERMAQIQHTTSLLTGKSSNKPYVRKGERPERKGTMLGLLFQLVIVMAAAVGIAYAIDPTVIPQEWIDKAQEHFGQARQQIEIWIGA
jgi:hypothetical protein